MNGKAALAVLVAGAIVYVATRKKEETPQTPLDYGSGSSSNAGYETTSMPTIEPLPKEDTLVNRSDSPANRTDSQVSTTGEVTVEIGPAVENSIDPHLLRINNMTEAQYRLSEAKAELRRLGADKSVFDQIKAVERAGKTPSVGYTTEGEKPAPKISVSDYLKQNPNVASLTPVRGGGYDVKEKSGRTYYIQDLRFKIGDT